MKILGICHDVFICSASVVIDGEVVTAMPEERLDRNKMSSVFPVRAIDAWGRLSTAFVGQTGQINTALDHLEPGLNVLDEQRDQLVKALRALDDLSKVGVDTIHRGTTMFDRHPTQRPR